MKDKKSIKEAFYKALKGFTSMLPILFAIILLLGLFDTYITNEILISLFTSNYFFDTVIGTSMGAVLTGNPMISYILGGELTTAGVSLFAVTAFILSWVSLGIVQLPAEVEIFGLRFTFLRTLLTFMFIILISFSTVLTLNWIA
ncbi:permease [Arcobacter arenosus]|uniref:permease n=1 Tax=Arcobacter arenosus TaxID=2576037 RepID=UPI003BAA7244